MPRTRIHSRDGFGLTSTILLLILFSVLGLVGLSIARQELRTEVRATSDKVAFYAAETGIAKGLDNWNTPAGIISDGTTWLLDEGSLAGGASYRVEATRLGSGSVHSLYAIRSEGRAPNGHSGDMGLLVATWPVENPFQAALSVQDSAYVAGVAEIDGNDRIPSSWNGPYCTATDENKPGLEMADTTLYEKEGAAKVNGDPPLDEDSDTTGYFGLGDSTFEELAAGADITFNGNTSISIVKPSYNADGSCNTSDPYNWGDPENPTQPCASWYPTIYVNGDLTLDGLSAGQGLLLVDGNLTAAGGFRFYGPVIVRGELISAGNCTFYGGVRARETNLAVGTSNIYYSACVLERVLSNTRAAKPQRITDRAWFERR